MATPFFLPDDEPVAAPTAPAVPTPAPTVAGPKPFFLPDEPVSQPKAPSTSVLPDFGAIGKAGANALVNVFVEDPIQFLGNRALSAFDPPGQPEGPEFLGVSLQDVKQLTGGPGALLSLAVDAINNASSGALEKFIRDQVGEAQTRTTKREQELGQEFEGANVATELGSQAVSSAVTMIPALAAAYINPMAGLATIGITSMSSAENRAMRQGYAQNDARLYGMTSGLIEAGTEALPMSVLLKRLPFRQKFISFLLREVPGELAATALDKLSGKFILGEDFTAREMINDLVTTAAVTPLAAGLQVGAVQPINRALDIKARWDVTKETMQRQGITGKVQQERTRLMDQLTDELVQTGQILEGQKVVWHGTPAELDPDQGFDADYVTSSWYDAAQGDAWGHYFSDSPSYAKGYTQRTTVGLTELGQFELKFQGREATPTESAVFRDIDEQLEQDFLEDQNPALDPRTNLETLLPAKLAETREFWAKRGDVAKVAVLDQALANPGALERVERPRGDLYAVAIHDTETFLNWGRQLSGQRPQVKSLLQNAGMLDGETGQEFYRRIQAENEWSGRETSEYLHDQGIPGAVYDRVFEDGPHKVYTVFSDTNPTIIELNTARAEQYAAELKDFQQKRAMEEMMQTPPELTMQEKMQALGKAIGLSREQMYAQVEENLKFDFFRKWTMGLEQLADDNAGIEPISNYRLWVREWNRLHGQWISEANDLIHDWDGNLSIFNPAIESEMDKLVGEVDKVSQAQQRRLTKEEVKSIASRMKLGNLKDNHIEILERMWDHYSKAINASVDAMYEVVKWRTDDEVKREEAIAPMRARAAELANRNFVPHYRFGSEKVVVRKGGKSGQVLYSESFRNEKEAEAAVPRIRKQFPGEHIQLDRDVELQKKRRRTGFNGVSDKFIAALEDELNLDDAQKETLDVVRARYSPELSFLNKFDTAEDLPGWSTNAMRSYATFMSQFANRVSKLYYDHHLVREILSMDRAGAQDIDADTSVRRKRTEVAEWLKDHRQYLGNPGNEWTDARALGFLWYLGFVPKAAAVNLTQVPLVALPYLSKTYSEGSATVALSKAYAKTFKNFTSKNALTANEADMIKILRRTVLDETQASTIGAISGGDRIERISGGRLSGGRTTRRAITKFAEAGAFMFQKAENLNRQVTALAAYDLARRSGKTHPQGVQAAYEAVVKTQFEYARYNRPQLMRGKKSSLFLFMQYLTSMMWLVFGNNPAKWRMLLAMLFAGGLQGGIPGAENIADLVDGALTRLGKHAGWKDPKVQVRQELREMFEHIVDEPDTFMNEAAKTIGLSPEQFSNYIMHGIGADIGGFDISRSLSFGRIVPGTELFARQMDTEQVISEGMRGIGGALGNIPYGILQGAFGNEIDTWRAVEKGMPTTLRNVLRAGRWALRGEETDSRLHTIATFDPSQDWGLVAGQALGFSPTEVNQKQERKFETNDAIFFYNGWRRALLANYWKAFKFQENKKPAMDAIKQYNQQVPFPEMKISPTDLMRSIKTRAKESGYQEAGVLQEKRYRRLYSERLGPFAEPLDFTEEAP